MEEKKAIAEQLHAEQLLFLTFKRKFLVFIKGLLVKTVKLLLFTIFLICIYIKIEALKRRELCPQELCESNPAVLWMTLILLSLLTACLVQHVDTTFIAG